MINKPSAYYTQLARAWMQRAGTSDIDHAKAMIKDIICMYPDGKNISSVTISTAGRSVKLDAAYRARAKEILKGLDLLDKS